MDVFLTSKIVTGAVELAKRGAIALETRIGVTREETNVLKDVLSYGLRWTGY
jgi:hypothetical protein